MTRKLIRPLLNFTLLMLPVALVLNSSLSIIPERLAASKSPNGHSEYLSSCISTGGAGNVLGGRDLRPLKQQTELLIEQLTSMSSVTRVSVYYRDLRDGRRFGINENEDFAPASLMKVAMMMGIFKQAQSDPTLLSRPILVDQVEDPGALGYGSPILGETHTVLDLIERMIIYSDNQSMLTLADKIEGGRFQVDAIHFVGAQINAESEDDFLSVREYAKFFEALNDSTYLSQEMSGLALELLRRSAFNRGMRRAVPPGTRVASKFGIRDLPHMRQLHECAIIEGNANPFLLCVMTRGNSLDSQVVAIREVTTLVNAWQEKFTKPWKKLARH